MRNETNSLGVKMIQIYTDATSNLSKNVGNLKVLPLLFNINDKAYLTEELTSEELYDYLKQGNYPKTSKPSLGLWSTLIEENLEKGNDILYISPTSRMTGVTSSISVIKNILKNKYPEREIVLVTTDFLAGVTPLIIEDILKDNKYIYNKNKYSSYMIVKDTFTIYNNNRFDKNINKLSLIKMINGKLEYINSYNSYFEAIEFIKEEINKKVDKVLISYSYDMKNTEPLFLLEKEFKKFTSNIRNYEMNSCIYSYLGIGSFDIAVDFC